VSELDERLAAVRAFAATSPYYQAMGMSVAEIDEGRVVLRVGVQPSHLNADGIVHGGVLPAIADGAMGNALRTLYGSFVDVPLFVMDNIELLPEPEPTLEPEPSPESTATTQRFIVSGSESSADKALSTPR